MKWFLLVVSLLAMSSIAMAGSEPNADCCISVISQETDKPMPAPANTPLLNIKLQGNTGIDVVQSSGSKHTAKNTLNVKGDTSVVGSTESSLRVKQ